MTAALIDRDAVWAAKRAALEMIRSVPLGARRRAEFDAFLARDRQAVQDWAAWCAIAEVHGPDWRASPPALTQPPSGPVAELSLAPAGPRQFHAWPHGVGGWAATAAPPGPPPARLAHRLP